MGIGSLTAIYTVFRGVMLKPLPYQHGERFVALNGAAVNEPGRRSAHNVPDLLEYQRRTRSFDEFGWFRPRSFNMTFGGQAQHVTGASVTPSLAHNLGVQPRIGRWFDDDRGAIKKGPGNRAFSEIGAKGGIRTPTLLRAPAPQAGASASSATFARGRWSG